MNKTRASFLVRIFFCISLITGIFLNIFKVNNIKKILAYYTLQTNIFCLIVFITLIICNAIKLDYRNSFYYFIKGEIIISTLLMLIIYEVALAPNSFKMHHTSNKLANLLVHVITPTIVLIDYVLFDEKGYFKLNYAIKWLLFPLIYLIFLYTYSANGGEFYSIGGSRKYAYYFLDIEIHSYLKVGIWILLIATLVIAIGFLLVLIDKKLKLVQKS